MAQASHPYALLELLGELPPPWTSWTSAGAGFRTYRRDAQLPSLWRYPFEVKVFEYMNNPRERGWYIQVRNGPNTPFGTPTRHGPKFATAHEAMYAFDEWLEEVRQEALRTAPHQV